MVKLSENFSLQEYTKSQTATRQGLDNTPNEDHMASATALFENVVQKVRDNFGVTVINSGYRGPALNLDFDQLILEFYTPGIPDSGWVHVSYKSEGNRKSVLTAMKENGKTVYKNGLIQ